MSGRSSSEAGEVSASVMEVLPEGCEEVEQASAHAMRYERWLPLDDTEREDDVEEVRDDHDADDTEEEAKDEEEQDDV